MSRLRHVLFLFLFLQALVVNGQRITGVVTDAETGDSIPMASVVYKGHHVATVSSVSGQYSIDRHEGWNITFSAVGYKSRIVAVNNKTKAKLNIKLQPDRQMLAEATVTGLNRIATRTCLCPLPRSCAKPFAAATRTARTRSSTMSSSALSMV